MKTKNLIHMIIAGVMITVVSTSCKKKGCTDPLASNYEASVEKDDGSCVYDPMNNITLKFTHNFDGTNVTTADFDQLNYVNANGETMSVTKLQYSISDVRFYLASGDSVLIDGYHLIDLEDATSLEYNLPDGINARDYTGIAFNFGFTDADNISGAYSDLNAASWAWPDMLGGGYHQMKLEGRYIDSNTDTVSYQYHSGSKIRKIEASDTTFHVNYARIELPASSFTLTNDATIEVKMNIAEWFKNPNTWDLNVYYTLLMPNYDAQILMIQNSYSVFSLGTITQ